MVDIISRSQWGAKAWRGGVYSATMSERRYFLVHYHGGPPPQSTGKWVPKNVEAIHLGNGWSGVGYNFLVGQDGTIYEGRGWDKVGAHCPGRNRDGIGVYVAIGGNQSPTDAAMRSVVALYREANRRAGRTLTKGVHGDYYATACAGPKLTAWVHAGMKADGKIPTVTGGGGSSGGGGGGSTKYYQPTGTKLSVKQIQRIVGVTADGYYGNDTKAAVKRYQKRLGVTADGLWGKDTQAAHDKGGASSGGAQSVSKPKPSSKAPKFPLGRGAYFGPKSGPNSSVSGYYSHRADLKKWQAQMRKRGWSIAADGLYGPATAKVARQFQKEKGLAVDGLIGPATWRAAWTAKVT